MGRSRRKSAGGRPAGSGAARADSATDATESDVVDGEAAEQLLTAATDEVSAAAVDEAAVVEAGADESAADELTADETATTEIETSPSETEADTATVGPVSAAAAESGETVAVDSDRGRSVSYRDRRTKRPKGDKKTGSAKSSPAKSSPAKGSAGTSGPAKKSGSAASATKVAGKSAPAKRSAAQDSSRAFTVMMSVIGAVVVVACIIASAVFVMKTSELQDERRLRNDYSLFAQQVAVKMTTLDADNADDIFELAKEYTTGRAQQMFSTNMEMVAEMIREGNAKTETTVLVDAVSHATDDEATVLMVFGWVGRTTNPEDEPIYRTFRFKVDITKINGEMKVSDMDFVP